MTYTCFLKTFIKRMPVYFAIVIMITTSLCINTANFNVQWENLIVWLNQNLSLEESAITFVGKSTIDGKGHTLTLSDLSQLLVDANSTLLLENIRIKGIREDSIRCLDNTATILLKNVEWVLDTDFTFDLGRFEVVTNFQVSGANLQFNYRTPMTSIIGTDASLILDSGLTFNYEPITPSRDLLELADETSQLILNGATIHSTQTGLRLTKGILVVDQKSFIASDATLKAEGVMFGDGINTVNNLEVIVSPAATLEIIDGFLVQADA